LINAETTVTRNLVHEIHRNKKKNAGFVFSVSSTKEEEEVCFGS